jgi:hypothetical protein
VINIPIASTLDLDLGGDGEATYLPCPFLGLDIKLIHSVYEQILSLAISNDPMASFRSMVN